MVFINVSRISLNLFCLSIIHNIKFWHTIVLKISIIKACADTRRVTTILLRGGVLEPQTEIFVSQMGFEAKSPSSKQFRIFREKIAVSMSFGWDFSRFENHLNELITETILKAFDRPWLLSPYFGVKFKTRLNACAIGLNFVIDVATGGRTSASRAPPPGRPLPLAGFWQKLQINTITATTAFIFLHRF